MRWLAHRKWQIENKLNHILFKWLAYRQWQIWKTFDNNNSKTNSHTGNDKLNFREFRDMMNKKSARPSKSEGVLV